MHPLTLVANLPTFRHDAPSYLPAMPATGAQPKIRAQSDLEAIDSWLAQYAPKKRLPGDEVDADGSELTYQAYRREIERFWLWLQLRAAQNKRRGWRSPRLAPGETEESNPEAACFRLIDLMLEDADAFRDWLRDPQPRAQLCVLEDPLDTRPVKRPHRKIKDKEGNLIDNPAWRPFVTGLSATGAAGALRAVNCCLNFLVDARYIDGNPFKLGRRRKAGKSSREVKTVRNFLPKAVRQYLANYIETLPDETRRDERKKARLRFLLRWYHHTGLRIHEMAKALTSDLNYDLDNHAWSLTVLGKGHKQVTLPLSDAAMRDLYHYRDSIAHYPTPSTEKDEPIVFDLSGKEGLTVKALHKILKEFFAEAAAATADPRIAEVLSKASTHWLRHSAGTARARANWPAHLLQAFMRHSNLATTGQYLHAEDDELRQAAEAFSVVE